MRKLFTVLATAIVLLAGSALMRAEAAPMGGLGDLSPITKGASPVETVGCWCGPYRCACRRYYGSSLRLLRLAPSLSLALLTGTQSRCGTIGKRWSLHDRDREPTQRYAFRNLVEPGGIEPPTS